MSKNKTESSSPSDPEVTYVDVPIELEDEVLLELAMMAHDRDITLNQLCREIIQAEIDRLTNEHSIHSQE
jgi:predicted DNA-binding ribbon-helix-helix protein